MQGIHIPKFLWGVLTPKRQVGNGPYERRLVLFPQDSKIPRPKTPPWLLYTRKCARRIAKELNQANTVGLERGGRGRRYRLSYVVCKVDLLCIEVTKLGKCS